MLPTESIGAANGSAQAHRLFYLSRSLRISRARTAACAVISFLMVVPCWWQARIAAGDLASHIYNAWLVQLVREQRAPGLFVAFQSTNVLFDLLLSWLADRVGMAGAQRIAVSLVVLAFFWAAFALVSVIAQKPAWFVAPFIAILAYGTVFNQGLFNYYLGVALSLAALAVLWRANFRDALVALPLLILAWLAQPLPLCWAVAVYAYVLIARKLPDHFVPLLTLASVVGLLGLRFWLLHLGSSWDWKQFLHGTGLDQNYMLGHHFRLVTFPMLGLSGWLVLRLARTEGRRWVFGVPTQIYVLCLAGSFLIPHTLAFPWYRAQFGGVPERLGWLAAVFLCVLMAQIDPPGWFRSGLALLAVLYFFFLYFDDRAINRIEDSAENLVAQLPANQRVIAKLYYRPSSGFDVSMVLDRACIERCISFGNYEPATLQFRVHAAPGNSFAAWYTDESIIQQYFTAEPNGTLYQLYQCGARAEDLCMTSTSRSSSFK